MAEPTMMGPQGPPPGAMGPSGPGGAPVDDKAITNELMSKIAMMPPQAKVLLLKVIDRIMQGGATGGQPGASGGLQNEIQKRGAM